MAQPSRFLTLRTVAGILGVSEAETYALVRSGILPAIRIKIGGLGQWRVENTALDEYIDRTSEQTRTGVKPDPFGVSRQQPARRGCAGCSS